MGRITWKNKAEENYGSHQRNVFKRKRNSLIPSGWGGDGGFRVGVGKRRKWKCVKGIKYSGQPLRAQGLKIETYKGKKGNKKKMKEKYPNSAL